MFISYPHFGFATRHNINIHYNSLFFVMQPMDVRQDYGFDSCILCLPSCNFSQILQLNLQSYKMTYFTGIGWWSKVLGSIWVPIPIDYGVWNYLLSTQDDICVWLIQLYTVSLSLLIILVPCWKNFWKQAYLVSGLSGGFVPFFLSAFMLLAWICFNLSTKFFGYQSLRCQFNPHYTVIELNLFSRAIVKIFRCNPLGVLVSSRCFFQVNSMLCGPFDTLPNALRILRRISCCVLDPENEHGRLYTTSLWLAILLFPPYDKISRGL